MDKYIIRKTTPKQPRRCLGCFQSVVEVRVGVRRQARAPQAQVLA